MKRILILPTLLLPIATLLIAGVLFAEKQIAAQQTAAQQLVAGDSCLALLLVEQELKLKQKLELQQEQKQDQEQPELPEHAQEFKYKPPTPEEAIAALKRLNELGQPSKYHRVLGVLVGEWKTSGKKWARAWTEGPEAPPLTETGTAKVSWSVNGKWIRWEEKKIEGALPVPVLGILGYDNYKKKFVGAFHDDLSTSLLTFEGFLDRGGRMLISYGQMDEPLTDTHDKTVKHVARIVSHDKFITELHDLDRVGAETKVMEVVYTRVK